MYYIIGTPHDIVYRVFFSNLDGECLCITYRGEYAVESIFIHLSQPFNKFPITGICTVCVLSLQIILRDLLFVCVMWLPELFYVHPEFSLKNSY